MALVKLTSGDVDGVRILTLDDPDRRNAMSPQLQADLGEAVDTVAHDAEARVLVVTGSGTAFTAGADLPALFGPAEHKSVSQMRVDLRAIYDSFLRVRRLPIPSIAAVHGPAIGAGVNLALACDVRIAGPRARFGVVFTALGLHPGGGATFFLTKALGRQRALSVIMDGAVLDAEDALRLGLVLDLVDDPVAAALERAGTWAAVDPLVARDIKQSVGIAEAGTFDNVLDFEAWAQAASARNPQMAQAIARFDG